MTSQFGQAMAVEYVAEFVENLLETCTVRPTVLRCLSFKVLRRQELVLASVIHAYNDVSSECS